MRLSTPPPAELQLPSSITFARIGIALLAAVGAAFAGGAPTDISWWDLTLRAAFAFLFTFIGSRAHPFALAAASAVGLLALTSPWAVAAAAGLFIATQYLHASKKDVAAPQPAANDVAASALTAGLAIQALLRMQERLFFGATSLLVAAVVGAVAVTAWLYGSGRGRWLSIRVGGLAAIVFLVAVFGAIATVPGGRDAAADGVYATERGVQAASDGDTEDAKRYLDLADQSFGKANNKFDTLWSKPARLIPVLSQHLRALDVASANGSALTSVALEVADSISASSMLRPDGGLDVAQLQLAGPRLDEAVNLLASARIDLAEIKSPWLIPALATRIDSATAELSEASEQAELASSAATSAPVILGTDATQHFLVLFGSPAETREIGGSLSNWTLISMNDGSMERVASGRSQDLVAEAARGDGLNDPIGYPRFYTNLDPVANPNNLTALPSITDIARATVDIFPTLAGETIDGVIYVDPAGLAALLQVVGPVTPEGTTLQLRHDTLADYLHTEQYKIFPDVTERLRVLDSLITQVFSTIGSVQLPGPNRLAAIFGPAGRGRHLQMATFNEDSNDFLRRIDLLQDFEQANQQDFLSVTSTNLSDNKLDAWVDRNITYTADIDAVSGAVAASLKIELTSRVRTDLARLILGAPTATLQPGQHHTEISVWSPHDLAGTSVSGQPVEAGASSYYGMKRYTIPVIIDPGATRTIELSLAGKVASAADYELRVAVHPGATIDQLEVALERSDGSIRQIEMMLSEDAVIALPVLSAIRPN